MDDQTLLRYSRQILLPQLDIGGQQKLIDGSVIVFGLGGLGSPVAMYLAAAGVGRLGLVDFDLVELSNLQRQIIHGTSDLERPKVDSARARLLEINPLVEIETIGDKLEPAAIEAAIEKYDVVVDGTDNFEARYAINAACVRRAENAGIGCRDPFRRSGQCVSRLAQRPAVLPMPVFEHRRIERNLLANRCRCAAARDHRQRPGARSDQSADRDRRRPQRPAIVARCAGDGLAHDALQKRSKLSDLLEPDRLTRLVLPTQVEAAFTEYAKAHPAHEVCGLIGGIGEVARSFYRVVNTSPEPATSYEMDPRGQLEAMRLMRSRREQLLGIFHSHPRSDALPSARDVALAAYPGTAYLILSLAPAEAPALGVFLIEAGKVEVLPLLAQGEVS